MTRSALPTTKQVERDIGEAIFESGIGVGTWGDINARMREATEIELEMWKEAYENALSRVKQLEGEIEDLHCELREIEC